MENKQAINLSIRYILLLLLALGNLYLFYLIFTPLTFYLVFYFLKLFFQISITPAGNMLLGDVTISLIKPCIAGAAYYLLTALNLAIPMPLKKRLKSLAFIYTVFLGLNVIRIIIFSILAKTGFQYFDLTHELFWYFGSTFLIVFVWFINVYAFKIREIPGYTDLKSVFVDVFNKKVKKKSKKIKVKNF